MTTEKLESLASELFALGQRINKLSRSNELTCQTFSVNREETNSEIETLVDRYNNLATEVTENTEHTIYPYTISERENPRGQRIVTTNN